MVCPSYASASGRKTLSCASRDDTFLAFEIILEDPADLAIVQGFVQSVDHQSNSLRILNSELVLPRGIEVKDSQDGITDRKVLKTTDRVKLWRKYSEPEGFMPEKIKIIDYAAFGIEELRGNIGRIDRENRVLHVNGFAVLVSEKTTIEPPFISDSQVIGETRDRLTSHDSI
jgi:hypothetical protein